jgi:alkyl hydroperoxide reductase subunit AhpF
LDQASEFLSNSFETLVSEISSKRSKLSPQESSKDDADFDVIIVGSGYGGAIAARQFSSTKISDSDSLVRVGSQNISGRRLPFRGFKRMNSLSLSPEF